MHLNSDWSENDYSYIITQCAICAKGYVFCHVCLCMFVYVCVYVCVWLFVYDQKIVHLLTFWSNTFMRRVHTACSSTLYVARDVC